MSYSLKYYPDPGIAFDISKMLFVKLNSSPVWQSNLTAVESKDNEIEYIREHAEILPSPHYESLLFSYIPSNKSVTFLTNVIADLVSLNFCDFTITSLISYFENHHQVQSDLYLYYLGDSNFTNVNLEHIIRINKNIPDKIKVLLFGFVLNPSKYISSLIKNITLYYQIIKETWIPNFNKNFVFDSFIDSIIENTYSTPIYASSNISQSTFSYSLCFATPDFLFRDFECSLPYFISTSFTVQQLLTSSDYSFTSSVLVASTALSDKHRIAILNYLVTHEKVSIQELSMHLNISISATNHHVSILRKANMITCTRNNRIVLYSYNSKGIINLISALQYLKKGGTL